MEFLLLSSVEENEELNVPVWLYLLIWALMTSVLIIYAVVYGKRMLRRFRVTFLYRAHKLVAYVSLNRVQVFFEEVCVARYALWRSSNSRLAPSAELTLSLAVNGERTEIRIVSGSRRFRGAGALRLELYADGTALQEIDTQQLKKSDMPADFYKKDL